ncbi:uncharacterized protein Z518_06913 [Rhinocladiella mackenziei CBS 650.93]|uniref:NAD(P)-binding domain-containing protein n=1 Tax=Rhinocladiella mackenziei CBS 650.93 TaxID=1442369 RepID=A0A0D2IJC8_9EURO|nr:uncharacterized protein Z518_06913 [Rhinocladiella mackenziei CBS 650.93]KIX03361.1 hypothetical protein Z518_06913 [Rhinocladiella mackenziei CBS 650.93]
MEQHHILLLGATGGSGLAFIDAVLELPQKPALTLYVRASSKSKIPASATGKAGIRMVEGELNDGQALRIALSASNDPSFSPVSAVISFLGAYLSLQAVFTRDKSHPIADALANSILPTMKSCGVSRILALSTPTAFCLPAERKSMPWKWWFYTWIPLLLAPQANAEMKAIADTVIKVGSKDEGLEWTMFRVPHLTDGDRKAEVIAGNLDQAFKGSTARWVLTELQERHWICRAPMLGNA